MQEKRSRIVLSSHGFLNSLSILIGGFAMRYVVIYAGQMAQVIAS